jgi:FtsZ-binding cell division protein ZapB
LTTVFGETAPSPDAPAPAPDASPEPSPGTDAISPSSSETEADKPVVDPAKSDQENLLSVVQDAWTPAEEDLPPEGEKPPESKAEPATTVKVEGEQADKELADPTPEELATFKPDTRARIEGLIRQRKSLEAQVAALQPQAESFTRLNTYVSANRLSSQEVSDGLALMASLKKGDFKTFYEGVMPLVKVAAEAIGESLPDDLYQKVEEGTISEDEAKELTRLRHENSYLKGETQEAKTAREADAVRAQGENVRGAISQWEANIRARDPDFTAKQPFIKHVAGSFLNQYGIPRTPEDGVKMAKEVYAEVNRLYENANPNRPKPTSRQPNGGGPSSTGVVAPANSLQEAIHAAIVKGRSGL